MIPGSANPLLLASAAGAAEYQIERSLRFNSSDSAYLSRTPSVAGNRKTWTWAGWVKRSGGTSEQNLFACYTAQNNSSNLQLTFLGDALTVSQWTGGYILQTSSVYRDYSAWYHIVLSVDTTQATASNRVRLYVNGSQITAFAATTYPAQNTDLAVNQTAVHSIGSWSYTSVVNYFNGYLADIHFIDGQALDPTSFGEFDTNGVWQPKAYSGTYGTNGFHLPFSDNSTAAALGTDTSGAGNNWTVNNISVAAGSGNDSLVDTPTSYGTDTGAGGEVRGNYCTWNPLAAPLAALTDGNLRVTGGKGRGNWGTIGVSSGKWYWEYQIIVATTAAGPSFGFSNYAFSGAFGTIRGTLRASGDDISAGVVSSTAGGGSMASGVVGVALDLDQGTATIYHNNVVRLNVSSISAGVYYPFFTADDAIDQFYLNAGQRPFAFPAPSGFKALCTTNLPEPQTITTSGSYTGNGLADGPFVYLNGVPTAMTVNGTAVTFGTHADKLSNGFKVRTTSTTYNQNAVVYNYSITSTSDPLKRARAQSNP